MVTEEQIRRALDKCGYQHLTATEENLRSCFRDYWDAGQFSNLEEEDLEEVTLEQIVRNLLRL